MRGRGKGQRFDKYWRLLNDISDKIVAGSDDDDLFFGLYDIHCAVEDIEPFSDYEIKDKNNLLGQVKDLSKRWRKNHEEAQKEYEAQFSVLLERV